MCGETDIEILFIFVLTVLQTSFSTKTYIYLFNV